MRVRRLPVLGRREVGVGRSGRRCGCRWGRRRRAPAASGRCAATTAASVSSMSVPGTKSPGRRRSRAGARRPARPCAHGLSVVAGDDAQRRRRRCPSDGHGGEAAHAMALPAPSAALLGSTVSRSGPPGTSLRGAVELVADELLSGHGGSSRWTAGAASTDWRRSRARAVWLLTVPSGDAEDVGHLGDRQVVEVPQGDHGPGPRRQPGERADQVEPRQAAARARRAGRSGQPVGRGLAAAHLGHPEAGVARRSAGRRCPPRPAGSAASARRAA